MTTGLIVAVVVVVALVLIGLFVWRAVQRKRRTQGLRDTFGPEYDRAVNEYGSPKEAEPALLEREERVKNFELRPLHEDQRQRYAQQWRAVQEEFVDDPSRAVADADNLIQSLMNARGYPVGDVNQRVNDLSVHYPQEVEEYRSARRIAEKNENDEADTEDLRQAMVHYRTLFDNLLQARETSDVQS